MKQEENKKREDSKKLRPVFDYKDPLTLYNYTTEGGKILPARITNLTYSQQKELRNAVKKARRLNLLPTGSEAYDNFRRPEMYSKKPFKV